MPSLARRVADCAPAMLVYLDADLRVRFANRHCYELFGRAPREILGRLLAEMVDPRTLKYALAHVAEVERGNTEPRDYVLRSKDGEQRFVQVHAVPDRDASGRSIGYFACTADNSAARATREALALTQERLGLVLASSGSAMWDWDIAGCSVHYSPEFALLLGYGDQGLPAGFSFFAALHDADAETVHESVADAIHCGGGFDREFRMRRADGTHLWLRGIGRALRDAASGAVTRFAGTVRDISARKEAERQLGEASGLVRASLNGCLDLATDARERSRLDRVRRELLASANHALRTPLASIIAALELLRDADCPPNEQPAQEFLALALQNAERLARVVEQWLDMERIDLGIARLRREAVDLGELMASLLNEYSQAASERALSISAGDLAACVRVNADPARLRQALAHLLASAIERSPRHGVVSARLRQRAGTVTLLVEDDGEAPLPNTDLGLSVAHAIIEHLGGTLCVAHRSGRGAAFHVELPALSGD
jgi:PAS domain S-box-containing protein